MRRLILVFLALAFLAVLVGCACDNPYKPPDSRYWRNTFQYDYCNVCGGEFARTGHCGGKQAGPWCPHCPYPTAPGLATRP